MDSNTLSPEILATILDAAKHMTSEADFHRLCGKLLQTSAQLTGAQAASLYLLDQNRSAAVLKHILTVNTLSNAGNGAQAAHEEPLDLLLFDETGAAKQDLICDCFQKNQSLSGSSRYDTSAHNTNATETRDTNSNYPSLCIPVRDANQSAIGVLQLLNTVDSPANPSSFNREQQSLLEQLCELTARSLQRQQNIDEQHDLLVELSSEPNIESLLDRILREAKQLANAEAGTLYLLRDDEDDPHLSFALLVNDKLGMDSSKNPKYLPTQHVPLLSADGSNNMSNVASAAVHEKAAINVPDAYNSEAFDFSGTQQFDREFQYRSKSFLVIPLLNHDDEVIGVLQLINARDSASGDISPFSERSVQLTQALASYAAIGLNNQLLVEELKNLLDAFIKCIAQAIDAKSPHTSAHCQRIPLLTELIARAACEDKGVFDDFSLTEDEWYELNVAAWLHDCGKLATPDTLLDKATKLHLLSDQIETVKVRFACLIRETEAQLGREVLKNPQQAAALTIEYQTIISNYRKDLTFIQECNKGGEFMAPEKQERIKEIAKYQWLDSDNTPQPMLSEEQVYNLCIQKGTLTSEERQAINDHMVVTLNMLESLPFPKKLRRVPEYAAGHHERMDGTGFPRGLTREQLSIPARMMAVADVFEALTASDRPYKEPMKVSKALDIMNTMVKNQHLDPDIFQLFIETQVWKDYASKVLKAEQLDLTEPPRF